MASKTSPESKADDLPDAHARMGVLNSNSINIRNRYILFPDCIRRHLDEIDACPMDDIPDNIAEIHQDYSNAALKRTYEAYLMNELVIALNIRRRCWVGVGSAKVSGYPNSPRIV